MTTGTGDETEQHHGGRQRGDEHHHGDGHDHFDDIAHDYDAVIPPHVAAHYLEKRLTVIRRWTPRGGRVLDVGCGTGTLLERVKDAGFDAAGVDPSKGMLEVLRERRSDIAVEQAGGTALPFPDGEFDLVYCVAVLHHVITPEAVRRTLAEMVRVTKPSGHVLVWDHNPRNPYWPYLMARVPQDHGDERLVPEDEILDGLTSAGARPRWSAQLGLMPDFTPRALVPLVAALERVAEAAPGLRRLCAHNVVLAQKHG